MARYWENEQPLEVANEYTRLRWYAKAKKLQISRFDLRVEGRPAQTITLHVDRLAIEPDALKVFEDICRAIEEARAEILAKALDNLKKLQPKETA